MNIPHHRLAAAVLVLCLCWGAPAASLAQDDMQIPVPENLAPAFSHLLAVVDSKVSAEIDPAKIDPLVDFLLSPKKTGVRHRPKEIDGATAAYMETSLDASLEKLLKLTYNPRLPSYLTVPSTVRISYWTQIEGAQNRIPELWRHLGSLDEPVRFDGVEAIVNTPDLFSGAYYAYLLDRTMVLMRCRGKTVLLSLSMQKGDSDVGKKGAVLGPDRNWNYLYTGHDGLSKAGLGWVDSYMYDSYSITAYVETDSGRVRCGIFKWLRAGWAGINMVRPHHIERGLERFFADFKSIVEAPQLSDISRVTEIFQRIEALSENSLRQKAGAYFRTLEKRYGDQSQLCRRWFDEALAKDGRLQQMNRRQLMAVVSIETLKYLLGREHQIDVSSLDGPSAPKG